MGTRLEGNGARGAGCGAGEIGRAARGVRASSARSEVEGTWHPLPVQEKATLGTAARHRWA